MIKLTDIEIVDFGRHRHIKQKLEGNVIGLSGPNGKGKTTVLQAVEFGITGGIVQADNDPLGEWIRRGTSGGSAAKSAQVTLGFVTDSAKKGRIFRKITKTSTSRELTLEGMDDGPFSSDKKVSSIMLDLLGVDKKALSSTVFVKQGAIDAMFGDKTERRDFYTRLLMLGHLPKIADTIEGYRKSVASSIVDLSGVLDEAMDAERKATEQFETTEAALKQTADCSDMIALVSRLVFLFGDQVSAHEAARNELTKLGADPKATIEAHEFRNKQRRQRIAEIVAARLAHSKAETVWSEALRKLSYAQSLRQAQDDLTKAESDLQTQLGLLDQTVNYAELSSTLQRKVDASTIITDCRNRERDLAFDADMLKAQLDGADAMLAELTATNATAGKEHFAVLNDLTLREKIHAEVRQAREACNNHSTQCVVCGSAVQDDDYLTRSIESLRDQVTSAWNTLADSNAKVHEATTNRNALDVRYQAVRSELEATRTKLNAALDIIGSDSSTHDELLTQLELARSKYVEQAQASAEVNRLQTLVTSLRARVGDATYQTDNMLGDLQTQVHTAAAECRPWDTELDAEEVTLQSEIDEANDAVAALNEAAVKLRTAREWLTRTEVELETLCLQKAPLLPEDLYPRGTVMTPGLASDIATKLRSRQSEYDSLTGALEAARTAMANAQGRVVDTEIKIEGQRQRIELAARLERLRDAFRPTGVTMDYLDYKFSQVAALASDYLAESGADFTVVASESEPLSFDFIRMAPGEEWLSQSRLSGGQRIRLAVATLRAIHSLVVPNVGLLVLDEPTTHLDTEAKLAMAEMLRRIGNEGGLQILVCDHDPVILDACSSIIEIPN